MGACAAKPLEATTRAPEEENSIPGSAQVTTTPVETTTAAEVIKTMKACKREFFTMNMLIVTC